ncbi:MAG TPA: nucleotidyl transferase AbiEii/AbiGii toxin family protein [Pyrinomonadaceae bacterium]|jgi:hypothetical protein|nr:nucleotidyl transferase AbiEii/AbiGii toxin family protein [Pyrinomonadaceae bacterium]
MPRLYDELRTIIDALDRNEIEYALCGGLAMAVHGSPRTTIDIDILISENSLTRVIEIAEQLGYTIRGLDLNFGEVKIRRVSKIDSATKELMTLDMLLVTSKIEKIWKSRIRATLEGGKLSVVSKDGLIALKKLAGRPQDIADIVALSENENAS